MPMRNPFSKKPDQLYIGDENKRPTAPGSSDGFQSANVVGSTPKTAHSILKPLEYKLSEINDSGVYLPPSPSTEKPSFWHSKSNTSTTSSNHRSMLNDSEPFNISRESFDSYRRSFDISARSPVVDQDARPRRSLDARKMRLPSTSTELPRPPPVDEGFEDVGLNDEAKPKKKGLFSRFGDSEVPDKTHGHLFGRKRGQSGQGAELGNIKRPTSSHEV